MIYEKGKLETEGNSDVNASSKLLQTQSDFNQIFIENCDVEGDQKVIKIEAIKISTSKIILSTLLSIITGTIFALVLRNSLRIRLKSIYNKSDIAQATHFLITNFDGSQDIVKKINSENKNNFLFVNRHMKYRYFDDGNKKAFYPVYYHQIEKQTLREINQIHCQGLNNHKVEAHLKKYGNCQIQVPIPTLFEYLVDVLTKIFYIFQYISVLFWVLEGFLQFAIVMICVSVVITLINYYLLRLSMNKLKKFAKIDLKLRVIRNGQDQTINSVDLLPGDLFYYQNNMQLPCDSLLLSGDVLVNESSLTGESIPVPKISIQQNEQQDEFFNIETMKNNVLFEGTRVIQIKGEQIYGIALRTGYASFRGSMFRAMLYPKEIEFNFYRNGIYFILVLICLAMIAYLIELYFVIQVNLPTVLIIYRIFDVLTWIIPPALPIFFSICQTISLLRLGKKQILATDPAKVVVAGDVSIMCFDKTGTLTKDSMEIYGYCDYLCNQIKQKLAFESEKEKLLHKFFGSCHGVYLVNGENLGDELDIRMLEFSQYKILPEESKDFKFKVQRQSDNSLLTIYKVWEFESSLQRMTVIMNDEQTQKMYGIVKGSPEKIFDMCNKNSIDQNNYKKMLNELTNKGLRVIAFGYREINNKDSIRSEVEQDIQFLGLFVLENKLKVDTSEVILRLQNGSIQCKVISGDNLLTTIQCAKEANILADEPQYILVCNQMSDCYIQSSQEKIEDPLGLIASQEIQKYSLGITGKFLEDVLNSFENRTGQVEKQTLKNLLTATTVFSRCKPKQKAEIIYLLQTILNEKVGMIGDGANDCSAIKQADIGISFTKTDASYSSPFSYSESSLECVIKVLAEGRCTLSNMIEVFKNYLTMNMLKFVGASILILELSHLSNFQITFQNYLQIVPFFLMLSLCKPLNDLTPYRQITNMMGIENFFSVIGLIIISSGQILTSYFYLRSQSWYIQNTEIPTNDQFIQHGQAIGIIFLSTTLAFDFILFSLYLSYPIKQRIYQNYILFAALSTIFIYMFFVYLLPEQSGQSFLDLDKEAVSHNKFMGIQLIIALCFGFGMILYEDFIVKRYLGPCKKSPSTLKKTSSQLKQISKEQN
ncbi:hypothetical protein ABPG74_005260 [Tetrahymena malaccensis]